MTTVLEVAEGGVTFLFYYPPSTSTSTSNVATSVSVASRRSSSATYHKAAASQSTELWSSAPTETVITTDGVVTTILATPSAYAPAVAFSTYAYTDPAQNETAPTGPDPAKPSPVVIATVSVFCFLTVFAVGCISFWLLRRHRRRRRTPTGSSAVIRSDKPSRSRSTRGLPVVTPYHTDSDADGFSPTTASGASLLRHASSARPILDVSDTVTFGSRSDGRGSADSAGTFRSPTSASHSPLSAVRPPVSQTTGTVLDRVDEDSYSTFGDVAQAAPFDFNAAPPYTLEAGARLPAVPARNLLPVDSPLMPPPPAYVDQSDGSIRRGRPPSTRSRTTRYSLATEDDDDALAQDGSSLARTLTTESSGTIMSFSTRRRSDTSGTHYASHDERRGSAPYSQTSETDETSTATWTDEDSYANDTDSDVVVAGPGLIRRPTTTATYYTTSALSPNGTYLSPFADSPSSSATSASQARSAQRVGRSVAQQRDDPFADPAKDGEVRSYLVGDDEQMGLQTSGSQR